MSSDIQYIDFVERATKIYLPENNDRIRFYELEIPVSDSGSSFLFSLPVDEKYTDAIEAIKKRLGNS